MEKLGKTDIDEDPEFMGDDESTIVEEQESDYDEDEDEEEEEEEEEEDINDINKKLSKKTFEEEEEEEAYSQNEESDEESISTEDNEENYKKINVGLRTNIVQTLHPELKYRNREMIDSLCTVLRNREGVIVDPLHRTLPIMTKYERARILGERARQLEEGAEPFVKVSPEMMDSYVIAEMELREKAIPFIVERPLPNGGCEYWRIADLE